MVRDACIDAAASNQRGYSRHYKTREDTGIADVREPYPGILSGGDDIFCSHLALWPGLEGSHEACHKIGAGRPGLSQGQKGQSSNHQTRWPYPKKQGSP